MLQKVPIPLPPAVEQALLAAAVDIVKPPDRIPDRLPLVPLGDAWLSVGTVAPLQLVRPLARAAAEHAWAGDRWLSVFSRIGAESEAPRESELHRVGTLVSVSAAVSHATGLWLVVRALAWVRLVGIEAGARYEVAHVEPFAVREEGGSEVAPLELVLRARVRAFAATLPDPEPVLAQTARMSALELSDATIANLAGDVAEQARYMSESSLVARLKFVIALLDRAF